MKVKQIPTGIKIDGEEVVAVELTNNKGTYVKIFNYGTIINKFIVKNSAGQAQDIVLGFEDFEQYIDPAFMENNSLMGAVVGRYANRIKGGQFTIDGENYQLNLNAGPNTLHGGVEGFNKKIWDIVELRETPHASVTFEYESADGEEHFPGNLVVDLTFELTDHDELILSYEADADRATPINLTHHSYFNLSATGGNIGHHQQQIFASNYLEQDADYVVTGKIIPVEGSALDFRKIKNISAEWDAKEGYDQTLVLDKMEGELSLASKTIDAESGLTLSVFTTEPVLHLYTSKYLRAKNGKGGVDYMGFDGICLEAQHHPNAVNIPEFPSTVLLAEDLYTQTTIYKVSLIN